jgi:flagellar biosynthesis protein FlhF
MRIKTFYAKSMADAMQEIKAALGPDALLLSTREIRRRSGVGGPVSGFEVVAASDDSAKTNADVASPSNTLGIASGFPGHEQDRALCDGAHSWPGASLSTPLNQPAGQSRCVWNSRRTFAARLPEANATQGGLQVSPFSDALCAGLYRDLVASGVDEWLTRKLLLEARVLIAPAEQHSRSALIQAAGQAAQALVSGANPIHRFPARRVVAFFGPTGVGKTTSIAKLAAWLALKEKKKVALITLDSYRIGALEQARTYAGLIGIPFRFVSQVEDLRKAVGEYVQRDCILIDTAGRSPRDQEAIRFTADCLQTMDQVERHLVLSATTKPSDIQDIVERFQVCRPDHLLFTKLDETSTLGPILNELIRTRKSMSYYSNGQRVPEDFHTVPPEELIQIVLQRN